MVCNWVWFSTSTNVYIYICIYILYVFVFTCVIICDVAGLLHFFGTCKPLNLNLLWHPTSVSCSLYTHCQGQLTEQWGRHMNCWKVGYIPGLPPTIGLSFREKRGSYKFHCSKSIKIAKGTYPLLRKTARINQGFFVQRLLFNQKTKHQKFNDNEKTKKR